MYFFSYTDTLATKPNPFTLNPNAPRQPSTARLTPPRSGFVQPRVRVIRLDSTDLPFREASPPIIWH